MEEAAHVIKSGGLVAFPTETVYGLGADSFNEEACAKVFQVKKRPRDNPLIVHISNVEQLHGIAQSVPEVGWKVADRAWPGPLTIVLKKSRDFPAVATGGLDSVGVRMPAHPVALRLVEMSDTPIGAPSANLSGRPSPTTAKHVVDDLGGKIDMVLDAGETFFGVESTIVDLTGETPNLLRPGPFTVNELESVLGTKVRVSEVAKGWAEAEVAGAPGMKYRHYAPSTKLVLIDVTGDAEALKHSVLFVSDRYRASGEKVLVLATDETVSAYIREGHNAISMGTRSNLYTVAKNLYRELRRVDSLGVSIAICEPFEERGIGLAIMNRLRKAASVSVLSL